jgi:multidrug efflux pump subunit AcrA (membrane-fusion protein)
VAKSHNTGVTAYEVKLSFDPAPARELKIGMSATADILVTEQKNALLVPNQAIKRNGQETPIVQVLIDQKIEPRSVETGMSDGIHTEVLNGLSAGEMVLAKSAA